MLPESLNDLDWRKQDGLLPVIVQDQHTHRVLMLGYMNQQALDVTLATGSVTFFSRSRQQLWTKGEQSGHRLELVSIDTDCDRDTLLVQAIAHGHTCHLQRCSCFADAPGDFLAELDHVIAQRALTRPAGSYTSALFASGVRRIAQKVGEEGVETALAGVVEDDAALLGEAADLLYHLLVLLRARGLGADELLACLQARQQPALLSLPTEV